MSSIARLTRRSAQSVVATPSPAPVAATLAVGSTTSKRKRSTKPAASSRATSDKDDTNQTTNVETKLVRRTRSPAAAAVASSSNNVSVATKKKSSKSKDVSSDHDDSADSADAKTTATPKMKKSKTATATKTRSMSSSIAVGEPGWGASTKAEPYLPPVVHQPWTIPSRTAMLPWTYAIVTSLSSVADDHKANRSGKDSYMRDQFQHMGFKTPDIRSHMKDVVANMTHAMASERELIIEMRALWALHEREYHHCALELALRHTQLWTIAMLPIFEELIQSKSWWDTVDTISPMVGTLLNKYPQLRDQMDIWIGHTNKWIRRAAIIHQLKYKGNTDTKLLFRYCTQSRLDQDFFIRKAIGWALREYSKTDKVAVRNYINATHDLSALSVKEGGKYC